MSLLGRFLGLVDQLHCLNLTPQSYCPTYTVVVLWSIFCWDSNLLATIHHYLPPTIFVCSQCSWNILTIKKSELPWFMMLWHHSTLFWPPQWGAPHRNIQAQYSVQVACVSKCLEHSLWFYALRHRKTDLKRKNKLQVTFTGVKITSEHQHVCTVCMSACWR